MNQAKKLLEIIVAKHHQTYKENPNAEIRPMIIIKAGTEITIIPLGDESRETSQGIVRQFLRQSNADAYVFFSESWLAKYNKEDISPDGSIAEEQAPSKRENRIEIIVTLAVDRDENMAYSFLELIRDWKNGGVTELKPFSMNQDGIASEWANLFH